MELYNLRRNVSNGLQIEEFPCTSCLPDTSSVDIAYNIWEADLFLRSKINNFSLLELGIGYSPYRVQSEAFYSRELQQLIPHPLPNISVVQCSQLPIFLNVFDPTDMQT